MNTDEQRKAWMEAQERFKFVPPLPWSPEIQELWDYHTRDMDFGDTAEYLGIKT